MNAARVRTAVSVGAFLAAPYLAFFGGTVGERSIPGALLVAWAGVFAPGAAFLFHPGERDAPRTALRFLGGAALLHCAAILLRWATGIPATPAAYAAILGVFTTATGVAGVLRGGERPLPHRPTAFVGLAAAALAVVAGMRVVPPLEDQDMEVQGTAYGIMYELAPVCLTNRGTLYFLAHPPLLHLFNASTLTLANQLETVRPAYDAAIRERSALPPAQRTPSLARTFGALGGPQPRPDRTLAWTREVYGAFLRAPALLGTRAPNFAFAAALAMLLFAALRRLGARSPDAALLTLTQATLPEIFVRSGYGGYFALSAFVFLAAAWLAARAASVAAGGAEERGADARRSDTRAAFLAGALAMFANHKSVLLGGASLVFGPRRARPLLAGLAGGALVFAAIGLVVAPEEFVSDHLVDHGIARFVGSDAAGADSNADGDTPGRPVYPTRAGLWLEFARNFGPLWCALVVVAIVAAASGAWRRREDDPETSALVLLALAWVFVGAALFTATDWRQTKHLAKLVPAMTLLLGALLVRAPAPFRVALRAGLGVSFGLNVAALLRLARDFESLRVTPLW